MRVILIILGDVTYHLNTDKAGYAIVFKSGLKFLLQITLDVAFLFRNVPAH